MLRKKYYDFFGINPSKIDISEIKKLFNKVLDKNLTTPQEKRILSYFRSNMVLSDGKNDYPIQTNSAGIYLPVNEIVSGDIYLHIHPGIIDNQNINGKKILINGKPKPVLWIVITAPNLGQITMVGDTPTTSELETAIKVKNNNYQNGDVTFSNITSTGALATGNPNKYTGTVSLIYSK